MIAATYPRAQHWTTGGFRITVLLYKREPAPCRTCGDRLGRHSVWADGRGDREGWTAGPDRFCDVHRPVKDTLPPLNYVRLIQGSGAHLGLVRPVIYERTEPWPGRSCSACGAPPVFQLRHLCPGCDDPAKQYATRRYSLRPEGITSYPAESHHQTHPVGEEYRCRGHALPLQDGEAA